MKVKVAWVALLLALTLSTAAFAAGSASQPLRPTESDLSCRYQQKTVLAWRNGRTTSQAERMMMESSLTGLSVPQAFLFARSIPSCWAGIKEKFQRFEKVMAVFIAERENEALFGTAGSPKSKGQKPGQWAIPPEGRHYGGEPTILQGIQHCATVNQGAAQCATSPLLTDGMKALLDLQVVNGKCVLGNPSLVTTPHNGKPDPIRGKLGLVKVGTIPALTPDQLRLLDATDAAHHASTVFKCGGPPTTLSVRQSHLDFEASATDETQLTAFQMKAFSGAEDSIKNGNPVGWTDAEVCKISELTHTFHHQWSEALKARDWARVREADNAHQAAHICMNLRDDRFRVKFPCQFTGADIGKCPATTCSAKVKELP